MICPNCGHGGEYEIYTIQGYWYPLCDSSLCLRNANPSGLCDYHYRRWQNSLRKRIQRWWQRKEVAAEVEPRQVSFMED